MDAVEPEAYREALSKFASGVTVVTVTFDDRSHGMTASSFASVSLDPPLVLVCLDKSSRTRSLIVEAGVFAVNVLTSRQEELARSFSQAGDKPFDQIPHRNGPLGAPLLDDAIARIECRLHTMFEAGDHDIVVGAVAACEIGDGEPLVYYDRGYRSLSEL